ncbi:MAG: TldD/PmbA family protein [Pseudomonadota bacterium]|nr:TldD/PmbA family protein [Pseudomonadota bacterium]
MLDPARALPPGFDAEFWSVRYTEESSESYTVRKNVALPLQRALDRGAMVTVYAAGGHGYAATSDLSNGGLQRAFQRAASLARATAAHALLATAMLPRSSARGTYTSPGVDAPRRSARAWYELLMQESVEAGIDPRIVDWDVSIEIRDAIHRLVTSAGGDVVQRYRLLYPGCSVTAHAGGDTQTRTLNGYRGICQQGADEVLDRFGFQGAGRRVAEEALELVCAPNCPSGRMDALFMPDQMILQIHESIGHPLELDRILGDERNFAGTSFVTPEMFGTYQYGSKLLNITFDPTRPEELASYGWDDDGMQASKVHLIRDGVLERGLGAAISQSRSGLAGTANARADNWNRPPIDRMANLNLEVGDASLEDMIGGMDEGVIMHTNRSWSIDDSRNKFQFGCERGELVRGGRRVGVVKNPNYRGISASFWRSLARVGNEGTLQVLGTPYCGKGEPAQVIRVGHASPACLFTNVDVFGGVDA